MTEAIWPKLIEALPDELTVVEVCKIFRRSISTVRPHLVRHGYKFRKERKRPFPDWVMQADWTMPNKEIGLIYGKSRERVRQFRKMLGHKKVESRGRKPKTQVTLTNP